MISKRLNQKKFNWNGTPTDTDSNSAKKLNRGTQLSAKRKSTESTSQFGTSIKRSAKSSSRRYTEYRAAQSELTPETTRRARVQPRANEPFAHISLLGRFAQHCDVRSHRLREEQSILDLRHHNNR